MQSDAVAEKPPPPAALALPVLGLRLGGNSGGPPANPKIPPLGAPKIPSIGGGGVPMLNMGAMERAAAPTPAPPTPPPGTPAVPKALSMPKLGLKGVTDTKARGWLDTTHFP